LKKEQTFLIGTKEIIKKMEKGLIERVVIANNIPQQLREKINVTAKEKDVKVEEFNGNVAQLGTKVGKPFPVASVGYYKKSE